MSAAAATAAVLPLPGVRAGVFLLRAPRPVLIDCGMRGQAGNIVRGLHAAGVAPGDLALIALTHWHIDHAGSLAALQAQSSVVVAAHRADAPIIAGTTPPTKPRLSGEGGKFARWLLLKLYRPGTVDRLLDDGDVLAEAGGLRAVWTPGHTAGHVCYYLPEQGVLFAGDALVHRGGKLGMPPAGFSAAAEQARASLEVLRPLRFERCYFGHGEPILERADERIREFLDGLPRTEEEPHLLPPPTAWDAPARGGGTQPEVQVRSSKDTAPRSGEGTQAGE